MTNEMVSKVRQAGKYLSKIRKSCWDNYCMGPILQQAMELVTAARWRDCHIHRSKAFLLEPVHVICPGVAELSALVH